MLQFQIESFNFWSAFLVHEDQSDHDLQCRPRLCMMAAAKPSDQGVYYLQMECFKLWSAFLVHKANQTMMCRLTFIYNGHLSLDHFLFEETRKDFDWTVWLCKLAWIVTVPV